MKSISSFTALLLCLTVCAFAQNTSVSPTASTPSVSAPGSSDDRYRIGFQDTLEIQVFRHPELNRRSPVNPDGTINLFRLDQPIVAVCKTENELANDIAKAYEKDYLRNPEVSVVAVERKSQAVHVIGAVEKPGSFYIDRRVQLLALLAYAGGPKVELAGTTVLVARTGSTSNCKTNSSTASTDFQLMDYKLRDVQEGKAVLWMEPGDVVSVMDADQVYVYGNVYKQGAVRMKEPLTLTQALAMAGGIKPATETDNIRVMRQKRGTTEYAETIYNFKEISKGKAPDPIMQPNDIVAVSQDKAQSILNNIGKSLTNGIPSIFYRVP